MYCEKCKQSTPWLTEVDAKWLGPCCVPDWKWAQYPDWKPKEELRQLRADTARANFHSKKEEATI